MNYPPVILDESLFVSVVVIKTKQIINQLAESTSKLIKITGAFRAPCDLVAKRRPKSLLVFLLETSFYKKNIYIYLK